MLKTSLGNLYNCACKCILKVREVRKASSKHEFRNSLNVPIGGFFQISVMVFSNILTKLIFVFSIFSL